MGEAVEAVCVDDFAIGIEEEVFFIRGVEGEGLAFGEIDVDGVGPSSFDMCGADPGHFFDLGLGFVGGKAGEGIAFLHVDERHDGVGFAVGAAFDEDVAEFEACGGG